MDGTLNNFDVIIIGGGPAGSSTAIRLQRLGHNVLIIEKESFPRDHIGESLVPFCYGLFEELGVIDELEKTAVRKPGVRFINRDNSLTTTYCFKNILQGPEQLSFHVLRSRFDKQLLDKAKEEGATIWEKTRVDRVDLSEPSSATISFKSEGGPSEIVQAKFVVDATGQDSFLAKKNKMRVRNKDLEKIAFGAHWSGAKANAGISEGLLQLCYLEEKKHGWIGIQAVDPDRLSIVLVVDSDYMKSEKHKFSGEEDWKLAFYLQELKNTPFTQELLSNALKLNELQVVSDYSYNVEKKYGSNYACIGDSAGFIDPIFATGIYLALNTSKLVCSAIDKVLKSSKRHELSALKDAYTHYEGALDMLNQFILNFYDPKFVNLAELGMQKEDDTDKYNQHKIAFALVHFIMGGDFFYEYKKYSEFVKFLKQPKQLARFMHLVIDQDKYKENSCDFSIEEAFPMLKK